MDISLMLAKVVSNMDKSTKSKKGFVLEGYLNPGSKMSMERDSKRCLLCPLRSLGLGSDDVGSSLRSGIEFTALGGLGLEYGGTGSEIQFTALDYERICEGRESGRELVGQVVNQVLNEYDRYEPRPTVHNMTVV